MALKRKAYHNEYWPHLYLWGEFAIGTQLGLLWTPCSDPALGHFTIMWVFAFTLLIYGVYIFLTQWWKKRFFSQQDLKALKVGQNPKRRTYAWHRLAYTEIIPVMLLAIVSGLAMYQTAQLHLLSRLFINWQILRTVHFLTVPISLLFILVHLIMGIRAGGIKLTQSMFRP